MAPRWVAHLVRGVLLDMEFAGEGGEGATPYAALLHCAMVGHSVWFRRKDVVAEQWCVMQPLLDAPPPVHSYVLGSWGPDAAIALLARRGRWHEPRFAS